MCGIVGVFGRKDAATLVVRGMRLISYRGRDGYGLYRNGDCFYSDSIDFDNTDANGSLGHCLHAIVSKVKQPFSGKGIFAVNCEIYNWEELSLEYDLKANNDSEFFFFLLERLGVEKTLKLVDGDYAGVYIFDNMVYLFRDRVGVKPMWYSLENGLAFSSERKVVRAFGDQNVFELNPREMLVYDLKNNTAEFISLDFYETINSSDEYSGLKNKVGGYLTSAIAKRVPDVKFGLLFSGAVDSSFIALILKKLGLDFKCYTCVVNGFEKEAEDLKYSKMVAESLGLDLEIIELSLEDVERELSVICKLVESNDVTKVSVAIPFYFASKRANEDGVKVILSGLGADDLFGGYERHLKSSDVNKECYHSLLNIYEKDLYRDDVITMYNNIELRVPYLDRNLISFVLGVDGKYKINNGVNKIILRDVAFDFGLDKEIAFRKKKATQYGGNFLKAIGRLAKKNKFKTKSEYLAGFYNEGNIKLAALFSSGKDSCYAMYVMKKQNYDIKCLITIKSKNKDSYMYHTPNVHVAELQAEALGIPIIMQESFGEKENELKDLEEALIKAKKNFGVEGLVVGALFSSYQRDRVQRIAEKLGLKVFAPLWHKNQEVLLRELIANNFEVILVSVAADGLDKSFLGRKLDNDLINKLIDLNKINGFNIAFEGGEAESLVLDCPMFKKRLQIDKAEKIIDSEYSGILNVKEVRLVTKN